MNQSDFDKENRKFLREFIDAAEVDQDEVSGSIIATMTQFLMNYKRNLTKKADREGTVSATEIIDSQIEELRDCIIDLEAYRFRLMIKEKVSYDA